MKKSKLKWVWTKKVIGNFLSEKLRDFCYLFTNVLEQLIFEKLTFFI